jgi:diaminopimelate decarboxylase/aspartate kinase
MPDTNPPWVVCKFGGTSVSTADRWTTIARVARRHRSEGRHPLLVCSALSGVSDRLEALVQEVAAGGSGDDALAAIRERHVDLARGLGLAPDVLDAPMADLRERVRALAGAGASEGVPPRHRAAVVAMGELLSSHLGAAFLAENGLAAEWLDARSFLRAKDAPQLRPERQYLEATCATHPDPVLQDHLASDGAAVHVTQGFIATNSLGETVLLGRGGSDTSAAYFAAKLGAERLEIWTDVPGLFTADPRSIPAARLLKQLDYLEAQELATTGARVLHPRCIEPVRRRGIPLHVRCTDAPELDGTRVSADTPESGPRVKAVSSKTGITAVAMDTLGMWREAGFLADVFQVFKHHGLSVDLVATSETNVTVTLDAVPDALAPETLDRLLHDLSPYCDARLIDSCAVVSLVGRHIRSLLSELGPAFEVFDEQQVHLVTQAASDLNFSFVVDAEQAPRVVREMHARFFDAGSPDALFGPSWQALTGGHAEPAPGPTNGAAGERPAPWWHEKRGRLLDLAAERSPRYVYDAGTLRRRARQVQAMTAPDRVYYAVKANPHPALLRLLAEEGLRFECVSPAEVDRVFEAVPDTDPEEVLFQPNFAAVGEYAAAFERGVQVTLDNVEPIEAHPEVFEGRDLFVRVDPGRGHGHHRHVRTAGAQSKFGIVPDRLGRLREAADRAGARITGLHVHVGSGITNTDTWPDIAAFLASLARDFPEVGTVNVGGGMGVPGRPNAAPLDLDRLDARLADVREQNPPLDLWMEPGRFLVAEAGVLLARVTQTKSKGSVHYVGVDTGMNSLLRPALYGAYHEIVNLSRLDAPAAQTAEVVGPICETGDVLGHSRRLPPTEPGDVLLVATTGAYGASMANRYNLRPPAEETVLYPDGEA